MKQRGNVILGMIIGVVLGLGAALAVAVYVTKVPIPFINKGQTRTLEQDAAEARKNRDWDPNAPLYGKNPARPAAAASTPLGAAPVPTAPMPAVAPALAAASAARHPASAASGTRTASGVPKPSADPLGDLAKARSAGPAADPFTYYVQVGAFRTAEDAESQRAKLSLMGVEAKVTEREQSGRTVFRVRVGPFEKKEDADKSKENLEHGGLESALVRVQR